MKTPAEQTCIPVLLYRIYCSDSVVLLWQNFDTGEIVHTILHSYN